MNIIIMLCEKSQTKKEFILCESIYIKSQKEQINLLKQKADQSLPIDRRRVWRGVRGRKGLQGNVG